MIIDCRDWKDEETHKRERRRCFVDGVEIKLVWYVDTAEGFVRTYDVLGDGEAHATREYLDYEVIAKALDADHAAGRHRPWDMPENGVMSKTIFGKVELRPVEE